MIIKKTEIWTLRSIVDLAGEHKFVPPPFVSHVAAVRQRIDGLQDDAEVEVTPAEAAGLLTTTWEYVQRSNTAGLPREIADSINTVWMKLRLVQRDHPIFVYNKDGYAGDGWYIVRNGWMEYGPFDSEDRAKFFWECRPCGT